MGEVKHDERQRRINACLNAFEGIPTDRIEGKDIGQILAGELKLYHAGPSHDGGFGFELSGGACQLLAEAYADQFRQSGAINYLELLFEHSDIGPLTITMQRVEGLTPAQKLAKAEADRDALAANLSRYCMSAGEADQRLCESRAVRVALGFGADAEDVAPVDLTDKIYTMAAENKVLDSAIGAIADAYETGFKDLLAQEIDTAVNITTPATGAYANQLRAEGVDMFAKQTRAIGEQEKCAEIIYAAVNAETFAANLRKENGNG